MRGPKPMHVLLSLLVFFPGQTFALYFGDLPDSYTTLSSSNGASHAMDGVTFLGNHVDEEMDGQPASEADGDDTVLDPDDEDGVVFITPVTAAVPGYLNVWVDYDGDADFLSPTENIAADLPLSADTP